MYGAIRSQLFAAFLLILTFVLTAAIRDRLGLTVSLHGVRISALDALALLTAIAGYKSIAKVGSNPVAGFALGTDGASGDPPDARGSRFRVSACRKQLTRLAVIPRSVAVRCTVPSPWTNRFWHLIVLTGVALAITSVPYLAADGIHGASESVVRNGQLVDSRAITASGALVILEAAFIALALGWPSRKLSGYVAVLTTACVVVLQHRTVWAAALIAGLGGLVGWSRGRVRSDARVVSLAIGLILISMPLAVWGFTTSKSLDESLSETTSHNSTLTWRTQSWQDLLSSHHSALDVVSGGPAGASWTRVINGTVAAQVPHDAFVEAFLRFGLPGVVLLLGLLGAAWAGRCRAGDANGLSANAVGVIVVAQAVFCLPYNLGSIQGLILGVLASRMQRSPRDSRQHASAPAPTRGHGTDRLADGMRITALLTTHNRCEQTLKSLRALSSQESVAQVELNAVLVDDGSTDGTEMAVRESFPWVRVASGSGDLYWAAGMALAEQVALDGDPDYLLWLNDDVVLDTNAVARLLAVYREVESPNCIVVGAVCDPASREVTYSGLRRVGIHPLRLEIVSPEGSPQQVEMFNGNVVLVPRGAYRAVGPIDGRFAHAQADLDYGLRARKVGVAAFLAPRTVGTCVRDPHQLRGSTTVSRLASACGWGSVERGLRLAPPHVT